MKDEVTLNELSREQILDLADAEGKKLGFLLAASPLDEETKKSILESLSKLDSEQIGQATQFFEDEYLMAKNKELNDWLKKTLTSIKDEFDTKQKDIDDATIASIDKLEKKLGE